MQNHFTQTRYCFKIVARERQSIRARMAEWSKAPDSRLPAYLSDRKSPGNWVFLSPSGGVGCNPTTGKSSPFLSSENIQY